MKSVVTLLIVSVIVMASIWGMVAYLSNLDKELPTPTIESEKKGRAKYLIDTRWPFLHVEQ